MSISGMCCVGCDWGQTLRCPWLRSSPRLSTTPCGHKDVCSLESLWNKQKRPGKGFVFLAERNTMKMVFFFFLLFPVGRLWGFPGGSDSKESACNVGDLGSSLGWEAPLGKEMETHSIILAWRIPWTKEPGGLQPVGSQRGGHDWVTHTHRRLWLLHRSLLGLHGRYVSSGWLILCSLQWVTLKGEISTLPGPSNKRYLCSNHRYWFSGLSCKMRKHTIKSL